jgi:hypothetical protein
MSPIFIVRVLTLFYVLVCLNDEYKLYGLRKKLKENLTPARLAEYRREEFDCSLQLYATLFAVVLFILLIRSLPDAQPA